MHVRRFSALQESMLLLLLGVAGATTQGCDLGTLELTGAPPDAGSGGDGGREPDAAPAAPDLVACDEPVANVPGGEHRPGQACLNAGCHAPGGGGPTFSLGGTVYGALAGGAAIVGASVHLIDAQGQDITVASAQNGNFWVEQDLSFPITTYASRCPDTRAMVGPLDATGGNCNVGGCHDADFRIHLP